MTHITSEYKERLSSDLKEILEDWYGGELMLTSIYGIRKYTNGSVLRMHVDTANTHVVSAIINVDQKIDQVICNVFLLVNLFFRVETIKIVLHLLALSIRTLSKCKLQICRSGR